MIGVSIGTFSLAHNYEKRSECDYKIRSKKQQMSIWEAKPEVVESHYIMAALACEEVTHAH